MDNVEIQSNFKKKLFKICDKLSSLASVTAIKRAFICIIPVLIVSTLTGIILDMPNPAYQAWLKHLHRNEILGVLLDIKNGSRLLQGAIFCAAVSHYYMVELKPRLWTAQWAVCPVALAAYGTFLSSELVNDVSVLGHSNKLIAMFVGLYVAKVFVFFMDHISGFWSSKKIINVDPLWNGVIIYGPPSIVVGLSAEIWNRLLKILFHTTPSRTFQNLFSLGYNYMPFGRHIKAILYFLENAFFTFIGLDVGHLTGYVNKSYFFVRSNEFISEPLLQLCRGIGGYGLAIPLFLAVMLVSTSYRRRWVAKLSIPFIVANSSEVILYGVPVVFNPILILPMILLPILNLEIFVIAHGLGIVPTAMMIPYDISPFPIYAYIMTGSAAMPIVALVAIVIDTFILIPFVKLMDEYDLYVFAREIGDLEVAYKESEAESRVFDESLLSASLLRTLDTLSDVMRRVLQKNIPEQYAEVHFNFQPQVCHDSRIVGAEVLVRWSPLSRILAEKPKGTLYPPLIIYLAYRIGMLKEMDHLVIDYAIAELMYLKNIGCGQLKLDINLTVSSITPELHEYIDSRMSVAKIDRDRLWITITQNDNVPGKGTPENIDCMLEMKNSGYIIGIDGFDTGAVAFDYLRAGFFNSLTFGREITNELSVKGIQANEYIVNMLIEYARKNDTYITANYLEDFSYMIILARMGVDFFQGNVLNAPMSQTQFNQMVALEGKRDMLAYFKEVE